MTHRHTIPSISRRRSRGTRSKTAGSLIVSARHPTLPARARRPKTRQSISNVSPVKHPLLPLELHFPPPHQLFKRSRGRCTLNGRKRFRTRRAWTRRLPCVLREMGAHRPLHLVEVLPGPVRRAVDDEVVNRITRRGPPTIAGHSGAVSARRVYPPHRRHGRALGDDRVDQRAQ